MQNITVGFSSRFIASHSTYGKGRVRNSAPCWHVHVPCTNAPARRAAPSTKRPSSMRPSSKLHFYSNQTMPIRLLPTQPMNHHQPLSKPSPSTSSNHPSCSHRAACSSASRKRRPRRKDKDAPYCTAKKELHQDQQLLSPSSIVLDPLAQYTEDDFNDDLAGLELESIDESHATNGYLNENTPGLTMNEATKRWTGNEKEDEFLALEIADLEHSFIDSNLEIDNTMFLVSRDEWIEDTCIHNSNPNFSLHGERECRSLDIREFSTLFPKKSKSWLID